MPKTPSSSHSKAILFYDGACPLCHASIRFVLKRDKDDSFYVSPLQGKTIKEKNIDPKDMQSVILYTQNGETYYKSDAVLFVLEYLGGIWAILAKVLRFLPKVFRNFLYDLIAKIRYKLAGKPKGEVCPLFPKNYQSKILL